MTMTVNMLTTTHTARPAPLTLEVVHKGPLLIPPQPHTPDVSPQMSQETTLTPKLLTAHRLGSITANTENRPIL